MNRKQALQKIVENRNRLKQFSVKDLYLFDLVVRDVAIDGGDKEAIHAA